MGIICEIKGALTAKYTYTHTVHMSICLKLMGAFEQRAELEKTIKVSILPLDCLPLNIHMHVL